MPNPPDIKSLTDIKNYILSLENKFEVDTWQINGIHIWPYIRIKIYIHFLSFFLLKNDFQNSENLIHKSTLKERPIKLGNKLLKIIRAYFNLNVFYFKLKHKKYILFGSHMHRVVINGEYFNRFYDSMVDVYALKNEVYMFEYQKIFEKMYNKKAVVHVESYLSDFKLISKIKQRIFKQKLNLNLSLDGYDVFYIKIEKDFPIVKNLNLNRSEMIQWSFRVKSLSRFFTKVFRKVQPTHVVFSMYYGMDAINAAVYAANKLNIKTVDLQHGPQTNHLAFSNWSRLPKNGFNTMVYDFWNWDEKSKDNITMWASHTNAVTSHLIGQPYLNYWMNKLNNNVSKKKQIIFSLQLFELEEMIPFCVLEVIKNLDFLWIFRLHPRNHYSRQTIKDFLKKNGVYKNYDIQDSIKIPLPKVLCESVVHITNFSGCLIEAMMLNVPTIIIHEIGKETYEEYIDSKLIYYLDRSEIDFKAKLNSILIKGEILVNHTANVNINPFI
ncbi:hypothetical protein [Lutibacter sp.]|uniref:hypothetical protein n=1 Tax=Lutibacter sp. TaxID=1925666 RepID=UPI001A1F88DE|nr:hypothetical protein [Lutibacter sp.]MBI9042245.1 hypothetical protein [Lutibacter sp.]